MLFFCFDVINKWKENAAQNLCGLVCQRYKLRSLISIAIRRNKEIIMRIQCITYVSVDLSASGKISREISPSEVTLSAQICSSDGGIATPESDHLENVATVSQISKSSHKYSQVAAHLWRVNKKSFSFFSSPLLCSVLPYEGFPP